MLKKILISAGLILMIYAILCLITPYNKALSNRSIQNQITYLSRLLESGYDDVLQERYPEGKLFSNALLALSIIEYSDKGQAQKQSMYQRYAQIVDSCILRIQSEQARKVFSSTVVPKYGMFYNGWSNLMYAKYRMSSLYDYSQIKANVTEESNKIEARLVAAQSDNIKVLDTYEGSNWPADNLIGILSLSNDQLGQEWLSTLIGVSSHRSGLIHHTGDDNATIRGSSSALITYCLSELDSELMAAYSSQYQRIFADNILGIQDSGPIVLGYGAVATIMNIKTLASLDSPRAKST